jgi:hypothetical protein
MQSLPEAGAISILLTFEKINPLKCAKAQVFENKNKKP